MEIGLRVFILHWLSAIGLGFAAVLYEIAPTGFSLVMFILVGAIALSSTISCGVACGMYAYNKSKEK